MLAGVGAFDHADRRSGAVPASTVSGHYRGRSPMTGRQCRICSPGTSPLTGQASSFVGDITYIHTWHGFIYLATVIDCYSRKIVGWSIADHMRTELIATALTNAAATTRIEPSAVFHSDRRSQGAFRALVAGLDMRPSMGRTGVCWDNSMAESFFAALKERRRLPNRLRHECQARQDIIKYIEGF